MSQDAQGKEKYVPVKMNEPLKDVTNRVYVGQRLLTPVAEDLLRYEDTFTLAVSTLPIGYELTHTGAILTPKNPAPLLRKLVNFPIPREIGNPEGTGLYRMLQRAQYGIAALRSSRLEHLAADFVDSVRLTEFAIAKASPKELGFKEEDFIRARKRLIALDGPNPNTIGDFKGMSHTEIAQQYARDVHTLYEFVPFAERMDLLESTVKKLV